MKDNFVKLLKPKSVYTNNLIPHPNLGCCGVFRWVVQRKLCSKKLNQRKELKAFENNKEFFSNRLDILTLIKLYDDVDIIKDIIMEPEHKKIIKEISTARTGFIETICMSKESALSMIMERENRQQVDEKIIQIMNKFRIKLN